MAFNVQQFSDNLNRHGTLQTNKFEMIINNKGGLIVEGDTFSPAGNSFYNRLKLNTRTNEDERFSIENALQIHKERIDSVRLPSVVIDTYETKRYGIGPSIKNATNVRFEPFSASLLNDGNFDLLKLFQKWVDLVFDFSGRIQTNGGQNLNPLYLTSYKKNYTTDIDVKVYDNNGTGKALYRFYDAFPIGITNPALSWRDNNSLFKFDVSFSYTNWSISNEPALNSSDLPFVRDTIAAARAREEQS
jgi:hypothetical protein